VRDDVEALWKKPDIIINNHHYRSWPSNTRYEIPVSDSLAWLGLVDLQL
jgi:hypothetical protein